MAINGTYLLIIFQSIMQMFHVNNTTPAVQYTTKLDGFVMTIPRYDK